MDSQALRIRVIEPRNYDAVAELTARVYLDEGFSEASAEGRLRDMESRARETTVLVAEIGGAIVGAVSMLGHGSAFAQIVGDGEAEIRLLAVDPAQRGQGIAEALVRRVIALAQDGCERLVLSTQPSMEAAQRLYARLGFERVPERDWRRASGRPMLVFALTLAGAKQV